MKAILATIVCHLFLVSTYAQPSSPIVDTAKLWHNLIFYYNPMHQGTEQVRFTTDTVISGLHYKKVARSLEQYPADWAFYGYVREEAGSRVYYRISADKPDRLILAMDLDLHETVRVYSLLHYDTQEFDSMDYTVTGIDSIMIGESWQKQLHMSVEGDMEVNQWVATMGGTGGMLHNWNGMVGSDGYSLLCFSEDDTLKYMDPGYNSCYVVTGTGDYGDEQADIKMIVDYEPGGVILKLINRHEDHFCLEVFDLMGTRIMESADKKELRISRGDSGPGIRFYRIRNESGVSLSGKFIFY